MSLLPRYKVPIMTESQSGKYLTFNDYVLAFDALVGASVLDRDLTAPPGGESEGDCYLVAASATGAWAGQDGKLAQYVNGSWRFYPTPSGFVYWVVDEAIEVRVP